MIDPNTLAGLGVGGILAGILILVLREVIAQHKRDMTDVLTRAEKREDRQLAALESNASTNAQLVPALTGLIQAVATLAQHLPETWDGADRRTHRPNRPAGAGGNIRDGQA